MKTPSAMMERPRLRPECHDAFDGSPIVLLGMYPSHECLIYKCFNWETI